MALQLELGLTEILFSLATCAAANPEDYVSPYSKLVFYIPTLLNWFDLKYLLKPPVSPPNPPPGLPKKVK
jgi:hypothetical protein